MPTLSCNSNGVTDVTACVQAAINATPSGGTLNVPVPSVSYLISAPLTITQPISIVGAGAGSTIKQSQAGKGLFQITSSNVTLQNLILQGTQYTVQDDDEIAVSVIGASTGSSLTGIEIGNCAITNWGMYGILMKYVNGFYTHNCRISNVHYAGSMGLSVLNGRILNNDVDNIVATPNAYGIALTRLQSVGELTTDPCSQYILVSGNTVSNVINWEGLDTHAGRNITFTNNWVYGCARGIAVVPCPNFGNVQTYGSKNCTVSNNVIDSQVTDGSAIYGITVVGCSSDVGVPGDLAEDCSVSGNMVFGYGQQSNALGMAIYLESTRGATVSGNTIIEPGKNGIGLYYNNYNFKVARNTIQDAWSSTQEAVCINVISDWNRGFIGSNGYTRGTKVATHVLEVGLNVADHANNYIDISKDFSSATTALYDPGNHTHWG